ncbi:uncharacterized protein LOC141848782 isoform X2 [Brevipalpus obovatus]|uniref:uncharacterized protein LOC141848782 isoform X2 n=1 Tax=Brevipalpus obovatus TaxID=246614 RepID=UPI003D9F2AC1
MMEMKKTFITVIQIALVILIASVGAIFFSQQRYTQLCVRSEKSSIQSMCVLCDADQFSTLSYACTRQYMVPANTTEDQAHCLLTTCLRCPKIASSRSTWDSYWTEKEDTCFSAKFDSTTRNGDDGRR